MYEQGLNTIPHPNLCRWPVCPRWCGHALWFYPKQTLTDEQEVDLGLVGILYHHHTENNQIYVNTKLSPRLGSQVERSRKTNLFLNNHVLLKQQFTFSALLRISLWCFSYWSSWRSSSTSRWSHTSWRSSWSFRWQREEFSALPWHLPYTILPILQYYWHISVLKSSTSEANTVVRFS